MRDWAMYNQPNLREVDQLGGQLSLEIGCAVHYPAYDKRMFECKCGVLFPVYMLRGDNWEQIRRKHIEEGRYALA